MIYIATYLIFLLIRLVVSCKDPRCNETSSVPNARLVGHVFMKGRAETMSDCIMSCDNNKECEVKECRSVNFKWMDFVCELNKADVHIAPQNYISAKGYAYSDNPWPKIKLRSCAQIQSLVPDAQSGYYWIHTKNKKAEVYCDMLNYGGGWTLVASISSSSNNHLLSSEVSCYLPTRCVEFINSAIPCRKLSDEDIHEIATNEGTFRIDHVTNGYTAFYQIPAGSNKFTSECHTYSCPRIIVSHVYPNQWESNCRGTQNGFFIVRSNCYRVFDMHDNSECGSTWSSSKYSSHRVLYGYTCGSYGLYLNSEGLLFVK